MRELANHVAEDRSGGPVKNGNVKNVVRGTIRLAMSLGLNPDQAKTYLTNVDEKTAESLSYLFGGEADSGIIKEIAHSLSTKPEI